MHLKPITASTLINFVQKQQSGRIRHTTLDYYRHADESEYFIIGLFFINKIIGVTACSWTSDYGLTLVKEMYRNQGYGTQLLQEKLKILKSKEVVYKTIVAEDNIASIKMCQSCGLLSREHQILKRNGGQDKYTALTFTNKEV